MTDTLDRGPPVIVAELTVAKGEPTVINWGQFVRIELSACHRARARRPVVRIDPTSADDPGHMGSERHRVVPGDSVADSTDRKSATASSRTEIPSGRTAQPRTDGFKIRTDSV
jgi:hypothetical protein